MTEGQLEIIERHAQGGLPPGDGEHYVSLLVAEVRRLRRFRIAVEELTRAYYQHDERGLKLEMEEAARMLAQAR